MDITNNSGYWPIEDRVIIAVLEMEEKTQGGIVIASTTKAAEDMASMHGFLVAAGIEAETRLMKHGIFPGELVMYAKYAGNVFKGKDGASYRIMNASDVVAKAEGAYGDTFKARVPMKPSV